MDLQGPACMLSVEAAEAASALAQVACQFCYTTVFGWYATWLLLRSGHLVSLSQAVYPSALLPGACVHTRMLIPLLMLSRPRLLLPTLSATCWVSRTLAASQSTRGRAPSRWPLRQASLHTRQRCCLSRARRCSATRHVMVAMLMLTHAGSL